MQTEERKKIANGINLCRQLHGPQYPKTAMEIRWMIAWLQKDVCHDIVPDDVERIAKEILDQ
jgi:hypothetical protein